MVLHFSVVVVSTDQERVDAGLPASGEDDQPSQDLPVEVAAQVRKYDVLVEADGVVVLGGDIEVYAIDALPTQARDEFLDPVRRQMSWSRSASSGSLVRAHRIVGASVVPLGMGSSLESVGRGALSRGGCVRDRMGGACPAQTWSTSLQSNRLCPRTGR